MESAKLIQAHVLRECVGEDCVRSWSRLLPILGNANAEQRTTVLYYHMPSGSLLSETWKGKSIRPQKWEKGRGAYFDKIQKEALTTLLCRDIGLGRKVVEVLLSRTVIHFQRIEEFIAGLVDSLWLANEKVFLHKSAENLLIRKLIRKIFATGSTLLCPLVDQWKEWGNFLFHTLACTITIGELKVPADNNIFRLLNGIPYISRVYQGDKDMLLMQHVSHLISSRQMPYMGAETEKKSIEKFKSVLEDDFKASEQIKLELGLAARRIGGICKSIRNQPLTDGAAHISVTSSGEFSHSVSKGAQAKAVQEAMIRILTVVPDEDRMEDTPFGPARHVKGLPLWKTVYRKEDQVPEGTELFDPITLGFPKEQEGRFWGLDGVLGKQLMYVAWKEITPIPALRAEVVPEMGNKARFVTLSDYWLNVLQAPLAHVLVDAMKYHPSVFSSFHRQDQAWEAVKGLVKIKDISLNRTQYVLSSDLKDATNAQQWDVTKVMLQSFINGYGLSFRPEYVDLVLGLIGPRLVLFKDNSHVVTKTGIMMGESIAKPSLTLLNLAVEELAFLKHCRAPGLLMTDDPAPNRDWRYCHIGGDDHLVKGPAGYLNRLTNVHLAAGSHISPGQHGYSKICVRYTERLINLQNLQYRQPFHSEDYSLSTIVDSVKVRLIERGQSTLIKKDNKNVAIGKSTQLGGCLEWLPKDDRFYTHDKKVSIRNLFIERMGPLLPRKATHPRAYHAIHLPVEIGGYGLGLKSEYKYMLDNSPEPHKWLLSKAITGANVKRDLTIFRTLNTNTSTRGVESIQSFQQKIIDQLSEYPRMVNAMNWWEVKQKFPSPDNNARYTIARAAEAGILSFEEFAKRATRGNLFQSLLMGEGDLKVFNTRPYVDQYRKVWSMCEDQDLDIYPIIDLSNEEIARAVKDIAPQWYFDINQTTSMDIGFWDPNDPDSETWDFQDDTYINKYTTGFPNLTVGLSALGLRH
jgi:hypothetical protein